jgi:hypothetical protein
MPFLSQKENTVPQKAFKLNCALAAELNWNFKGYIIKVNIIFVFAKLDR